MTNLFICPIINTGVIASAHARRLDGQTSCVSTLRAMSHRQGPHVSTDGEESRLMEARNHRLCRLYRDNHALSVGRAVRHVATAEEGSHRCAV